jgi:phage terminase small subunit
MAVLKNPKHERFSQKLAKPGSTQERAYVLAGYKPSRAHAARLAANGNIQARVREIIEAGAQRAEISVEKILREMELLGFSNMQDYMKSGPDGDPYLDFSQLTREQAAALSEVTVEDFKDGRGENARDVRRVKFKLYDKRAALVDLGKHFGAFKENINVTGEVTVTKVERVVVGGK